MHDNVFHELKELVGFHRQDAENLSALRPAIDQRVTQIVEHIYQQLWRNPATRATFAEDSDQAERMRGQLASWLSSLFAGTYDEDYVHRRMRMGEAHVRAGLPQHYLFAAVEIVRSEARGAVGNTRSDASRLASLDKLLAIELALMLEGYQHGVAKHARQTERSAVQEQLTKTEHLARIGQLAASLAHEIKNPLAGISGAIEVIRGAMEAENPHRPILAEVLRQITRLDQTVKDLLVYSRPAPPRFGRCDLGRVIERTLVGLARTPELQRVRLSREFDQSPLPPIEADENQIEQLLINLILNAAHASDEGGEIVLAAHTAPHSVVLEIRDNGCGMSAETRQKALDPFFTTKARGTGLGLPICRSIVESHGGEFTIESEVGVGTTASARLPHHQSDETERNA